MPNNPKTSRTLPTTLHEPSDAAAVARPSEHGAGAAGDRLAASTAKNPPNITAPNGAAPQGAVPGPPPRCPADVLAPTASFDSTGDDDGQAPTSAGPALPGKVAGYEIVELLGHGGMGVVYLARQPGLKRLVALKMILAGSHASPGHLSRFRSEAEAVARLQHPNIVQIYEVGDDDGRPYFSLEYVEGQNLAKTTHGQPIDPRQAAALVQVLARAIGYAHEHGIVHRDLKPANILVALDGTPKITDFGLAKYLDAEHVASEVTESGLILGTPDYMAPEQALGNVRQVGPLSDVYALGAVLYELLTGRPPFRSPNQHETINQVVTREPVSPSQLQPELSRDLETVCLKCLQKDPARRYASAPALADDLKRFLAGEPILARPVGAPERLWRWCRRNPRVAALSAAVAALVVVWATTASALAWKLNVANKATEKALDESKTNARKANENAQTAARNAAEARENETIAEGHAAESERRAEVAKKQAERADGHAQAAKILYSTTMTALVKLGGNLGDRLKSAAAANEGATEFTALHADLLSAVRGSIDELGREITQNKELTDFGMASTCDRLGDLLVKLGHVEGALEQYQRAYDFVAQVAKQKPDEDKARANMGAMLNKRGSMLLQLTDDARKALPLFVEAIKLQREISDHPRDPKAFSVSDNHRLLSFHELQAGKAELRLGHPAAARKYFESVLAHRQAWVDAEQNNVPAQSYLSEAQLWLGTVAWHLGERQATREHFTECLRIVDDLVERFPDDASFRADLADIHGEYGDAQLRLGMPEEARRSYQRSRELLQAVLDIDHGDISRHPQLAETDERLAALAQRDGDLAEAKRLNDAARELRVKLSVVEERNLPRQIALALTLARCGQHAEASRKADDVRALAPQGTGLLLQAARCYAVCAAKTDDADQRRRHTRQAIATLEAATRDDFRDPVLLSTDPDLSLLAQEPAYQEILARVTAR